MKKFFVLELFQDSIAESNTLDLLRARIADIRTVPNSADLLRTRLYEYLTQEGKIEEQVGKTGNIA